MPRRQPGAVRADHQMRFNKSREFSQVSGVGRRTCAAVKRLEGSRLGPGAVAEAIATYESFLRRPGRYLSSPGYECPCCDPVYARDVLQVALGALPKSTGRDLRLIVARLDAEFERKTLPDPQPPRASRNLAWWHYRL